ncbi:MAG: hypothetical protein QNJ85_09400 [Gammaproteobacteria bacterium]|nr:hypothetical protein [Gammaproteobacteria bacterium]
MTDTRRKSPGSTVDLLRKRVRGGAAIQLDTLDEKELEAMQVLLFSDEAEIINSACKPFLVARADRILLPP